MIMLDNNRLEKELYDVVTSLFTGDTYLVIEYLEEDLDLDEGEDFQLGIKGRYGREGDKSFCNKFEIIVDPKWSYDFIKGYFYKYIEDQM